MIYLSPFSFLPLSLRKGIREPEISLVEDIPVSGYYFPGEYRIEICTALTPKGVAGTLAHEFRHHLQWEKGYSFNGPMWDPSLDYWPQLLWYFSYHLHEFDALLFEHRLYPDYNTLWVEYLVRERKGYFSQPLDLRRRIYSFPPKKSIVTSALLTKLLC